ncbi:hypothetical protein TRP66_03120 [Pseudomonas sp. JDS28PS106]|uniref:hypothetical protein n=1 Tax=Pseudomonas sp. JDS28PS106 TaxID=2497235 RepID=UPI002FCFCA52
MSRAKDVMDELTKDELLAWIRTQFFRPPKRSDILFIRWQKQSAAVLEEMRLENLRGAGVDMKERDRLAVRFNASTDAEERLRILALMEPYDTALMAHIKRSQAIDKKMQRVDALYEQIDVERQKEQSRGAA